MVNQAEIHKKILSNEAKELIDAVQQLRNYFAILPDKKQAWEDLQRLIHDTDGEVRRGAAYALCLAYPHTSDKIKAWNDLHELAQKNSLVRREAACAIGLAFPHIPDKKQAYTDLFLLSSDSDRKVRQSAINALGSGYPHLPDKKHAWEHLNRLTLDSDADTRTFANYAIGRADIFKATWAESEEDFRKELESALNFFEKSAKEAAYIIYLNPAKFCLPFYRSFYLITFKKQEAESDALMYLAEAKKVVEGSENKEKLLEAIENLDNALKEVHKVRDFKEMKHALIEYVQYCERAVDLLDITAKKAPDAIVVKRGLPIINASMIAEIHEKAKMLCKKMPDEERGEAWELLKKLNEEPYIEHKIPVINMVLSKISSQIGKERELGDKPKTFAGRFFEKINTPATIASFAGFIILEVFDIYLTDYNKHMISVISAVAIFVAVFIVTQKKN